MGFLDNLLRREVRRVVNSAVNTAVDSVMNTVLDQNGQPEGEGSSAVVDSGTGGNNTATESKAAAKRGNTAAENKKATRQENNSGERLLRQRIEKTAARELPQYELRQRIPSSQVNAPRGAEPYFDYGFYLDGLLTAVIIILDDNNAYRRTSVRLAQQACHDQQVVYMNFMSYMMNRPEYISQRLKKNLR